MATIRRNGAAHRPRGGTGEFGLSYIVVMDTNMEKLAPVVARLAGT